MKNRCLSICLTVLSILMLTLSTVQTSTNVIAASSPPKTLTGYIPSAVSSGQARLIGQHPGTDQLALAIGLPLRNEQSLKQLLNEASTPHNPHYRHYLTLAQENQWFNPTSQQEQQVTSWLKSHGLTVTHTYPNHLLVDVTGTFQQIEQIFHVTIYDYTMPLNGKQITFYAPANEPTVDGSVKIVIDTIVGLDDYPSAHADASPSSPKHPTGNGNADGSPPYYPQDFANAYDVNPLWNQGDNGWGQHIGITLWGPPPSSAALQAFDTQTGATPPNLQVIPVDGGAKYPVKADVATEAGMDVEYTSGMAPNATIDYYEAPDTKNGGQKKNGLDDALNMAGTDTNNNSQISNSWNVECEPTQEDAFIQETEQIFLSNTVTGHDYFFSSGDSGSKCGSKNPLAQYPASSAYVTSVGGTHFSSNIDGRYPKETAWNGSGGGYSILFPEPSWQTNTNIPDPNAMRGLPDVAADAAHYTGAYVCADGSNGPICTTIGNPNTYIGGTSLATPLWAGMIADVNEMAPVQPLGFINPMLYEMNTGMPYTAYHDIKKGKNGIYPAGPGWDAVTGWGSPNLYKLAQDAVYLDSSVSSLGSVAAVSANNIWAVGSNIGTLVEQWNGSNWAVVPSPGDGAFFGVATVSANDVWAVGTNGSAGTLTERWNGSSWAVVPSPSPGSDYNSLSSIAAVSATDVWAVGSEDSHYNTYTLIERWNGSSWAVVPSPNPSTYSSALSSIAVDSANDVWAVGEYIDPNYNTQTLIERWNGSSWAVVPSPNPSSDYNSLSSIAVVSANDAWAVGEYTDPNGNFDTLIEQWNGSNWIVVSSPNLGSSLYFDYLHGVAVVSATDVWAVGSYEDSHYNTQTLIEQWNGSNWAVAPSRNPGLYGNSLFSVTMVSVNDVWAVGSDKTSWGGSNTLTEQWNGSNWIVVSSPNVNAPG